ncbi:helix-turn-helix domain-containing protein [uncultured Sphingomonas sp.]|uniref:helix-turn-helix domain-containing protein n=1 Tax=uncultured Sphingomonas sp. TaxID=158754 RepID=UPI0035CC4C2A
MTDQSDDLELVRGSGNVFADFGAPDASLRQFRAILAAEIIKTLDAERLTVRDAEARTGIAAADFSRIRQVKLDRFTIDRLMRILDRLNRDVRVKVSVARRGGSGRRSLSPPLAA